MYPETDAAFLRRISAAYRRVSSLSQTSPFSRSDLDSHADTCCVGSNAHIHHESSSKTVEVQPFLNSLGTAKKTPIVSASVAYDCPFTLKSYLLHIHQALFFEELEHNLLNPNQCRMNDVIINECPKFLSSQPNDETHSIYFPKEDVRIPLSTHGVHSYLPTRKPTLWELDHLDELELTSNDLEWDPHATTFSEHENNMLDDRGHHRPPRTRTNTRSVAALGISQVSNCLTEISSTLEPELFVEALNSQNRISSVNSKERQTMSAAKLANRWNIGLDAAKRTLDRTTQRGIRLVANPSINRRLRTNDRQLRYRRLKTNIFTDTMFSSIKSSRNNNCAQIYCNDLQWTAVYPMVTKGEAHLSLSKFMSTHGAPDFMISDGAKELTQGEFRRKAREAGVHCKEVEPYKPLVQFGRGQH